MIRWLRDYGRVTFAVGALLGSLAVLLAAALIIGPWWARLVAVVLIVATARLLWSSYRTARYIGEQL